MNSPKQILTVCALAAASTAAVASQTEVRLDVGEKASRCDWELLSYETVDGEKGRFAHVVATAEPVRAANTMQVRTATVPRAPG